LMESLRYAWSESLHVTIFGIAILAATFQILIGSIIDETVVVQILEELEVRTSNCKPVAKLMMEMDVLHSHGPGFACIVGLEHSIAEATFVTLGRPHIAVSGIEVCQAMKNPFLFIREILQAVKEIERAFKTTACRRRHL